MNKIQNSPSFGAIKLSKTSKEFAYNIAKKLEIEGFTDRGAGDIFFKQNTITDKAKLINKIREGDLFCTDEFATIFLHGNKESFVIGNNLALEHKMLPTIQKHDPEARLNIGI